MDSSHFEYSEDDSIETRLRLAFEYVCRDSSRVLWPCTPPIKSGVLMVLDTYHPSSGEYLALSQEYHVLQSIDTMDPDKWTDILCSPDTPPVGIIRIFKEVIDKVTHERKH